MTNKAVQAIIAAVVESFVKQTLLYDFYGSLLTQRQREIYEAFALENYSFAEIADGLNISRQAVYDNIKRTNALLSEYEQKLQLVEKFLNIKKEVSKIKNSKDLSQAKQTAENILQML